MIKKIISIILPLIITSCSLPILSTNNHSSKFAIKSTDEEIRLQINQTIEEIKDNIINSNVSNINDSRAYRVEHYRPDSEDEFEQIKENKYIQKNDIGLHLPEIVNTDWSFANSGFDLTGNLRFQKVNNSNKGYLPKDINIGSIIMKLDANIDNNYLMKFSPDYAAYNIKQSHGMKITAVFNEINNLEMNKKYTANTLIVKTSIPNSYDCVKPYIMNGGDSPFFDTSYGEKPGYIYSTCVSGIVEEYNSQNSLNKKYYGISDFSDSDIKNFSNVSNPSGNYLWNSEAQVTFEIKEHPETDLSYKYFEGIVTVENFNLNGYSPNFYETQEYKDAVRISTENETPLNYKMYREKSSTKILKFNFNLGEKTKKTEVISDPCSGNGGAGVWESSSKGQSAKFQLLNNQDPCNPDPSPEEDDQTSCDGKVIIPDQIQNLISKNQSLLTDLESSTSNALSLAGLNKQIQNISTQIQTNTQKLNDKGFGVQAFNPQPLRDKIAQLILQKSQIESEKQIKVSSIQSSLSNLQSNNQNIINESNNLTSQSGNLKQYNFNDFNSFKSVAEDLKYEFDDYGSSENTYGLIEAAKIISEETSLYNNLVRVYSSGLLPEVIDNNDELPQYQDDETNYDKIQKPRQLINWLNSLIKSQTSKLESRRVSLDNEVKENQQKFITQKDEYFIALNDLENESEKLDQLLESLNNDLGEDFSTQSFNTKAYDPDSVDKWNKIMEGRQARATENRQFLREHFPLLGFLVDQVMDPFTYVPIPGAKAVKTTNVIAKPIFEKFLGPLSKPVWEKIVQRKGYAYATNSYKQLTDSMFQMSKKGKTYEKATETIKKTSDKVSDTCKTGCLPDNVFKWFPYKKHIPPPNKSWNEIIEMTKNNQPARYHPDVNIKDLETNGWLTGKKVKSDGGSEWKVKEYDQIIGANSGKESYWQRIERTPSGEIHGHPLSKERYNKLINR